MSFVSESNELTHSYADLHLHTTASDGTMTPREALEAAASRGLAAIAFADHDTTDGVPTGLTLAASFGVELVPAVEINTDALGTEIHLLGYCIRLEDLRLQETLAHIRNGRAERAQKIVSRLQNLGATITFEEVAAQAQGGAIGRPHIAAVLKASGFVQSVGEAFERYLGRGRPAHVPRYKLAPEEATDIVVANGGVAVLAHPGLANRDEIIPSLMDHGLRGLEVYHTDHTEAMSRRYAAMVRSLGLIATGGTDSHGPASGIPVEVGAVTVGYEAVEALWAESKNPRPAFRATAAGTLYARNK